MAAVPLPGPLLGERDYLRFWLSRFAANLGVQIESVAIGWQIYATARRSLDVDHAAFLVGMVGLASFAPLFLLALPAGVAADRFDRKAILRACYAAEIVVVAGLAVASQLRMANAPILLAAAVLFGAARAFWAPANTALGPMLVPREQLARSIAWNSLAGQGGSILGPAVGGLLVALSPALAYWAAGGLYLFAAGATLLIRRSGRPAVRSTLDLAMVREGLVYVWTNKIVFGAISLDMFAVLLGGATALLPVMARDVLHVGASGFGILRSASAVGAACVAIYLARHPIRRHAGISMFVGVVVFGLATIVFGLSRWAPLSVAALVVIGGADMLSVFVRGTLVQLVTPDPMRGRVAAVASLFVSASNELGEFRGGVVARFTGPIVALVGGGIGALIITGLWARLFPALRKADRLA
jgi:MFS family permease